MLNSAWPEMYWQLYDTYLMPNAAYYATKIAGNPMHAIYNYDDKSIYLINDKLEKATDLRVEIKVFDVQSKVVFEKTIATNIDPNTSKNMLKFSELKDISNTYFLSLKVYNAENEAIDNNFYWLSKKQDILDYEAKVPNWYYHTPTKQYANYLELHTLKEVQLHHLVTKKESDSHVLYEITLKNPSDKIAFFTELKMVDSATGLSILPVIWSDNYISLVPGETAIYTAKIRKEHLKNSEAVFVYKGWNSAGNE
jgi:exo-1,4-beta-D-glucosaminidase